MKEGYQIIAEKLRLFTRKFYRNELIKGGILFFSLGLIYFFVTLFIEYFLWLKPMARTTLFWIFILVELYLLFRFILQPLFKLNGLQKGISLTASSKIIGNHFPEVQDKLLNILQLKEDSNPSDLLLASIDQKAKEMQPIPFLKAVDFKKNKKYLKYAIVPVIIFGITLFTGNSGVLTESLQRVVNHRTAYIPPAPFAFFIDNSSLEVVQGKPFTVRVKTIGNVQPEEVKIVFNNQEYYLQKNTGNSFLYEFSDVNENTNFYLTSNGIRSQDYILSVLKTPTILAVFMDLKYPKYLGRQNETIQNSGNLVLPVGTEIQWKIHTIATDSVSFLSNDKRRFFKKVSENDFVFQKRILIPFSYQISSSNTKLKDFERLAFSVDVIKDDFPRISIQSNIDSVSRGTAQFAGQISDDYGLRKLQLVYYDKEQSEEQNSIDIPIAKENLQTFYYEFPGSLDLLKGVDYELFFQVFDNDEVYGSKKTKTKIFEYRQKTTVEIDEELLEEQKNTINDLESTIQNQRKQQQELEKIQQAIQQKKNISWNDEKKVQTFIKRQEQYQKMMQRQTDELQENLTEKKEESQTLQSKKEELKKRIEELKKVDKQQKLLDEIAEIAKKLNKEDLVKKAKELAQQNKQQERSLERTLELVKRFYIEQKTMQIANQLEELAKKQSALSKKEENTLASQKEINIEFEKLKKELEELAKDNEKLKEPIELPDTEDEKQAIDEGLKKAAENLSKEDQKQAKKNQKKASNKMTQMSAKMQQSMMALEMDSIEENMDDLRKILENLITFSFKQEHLMNTFNAISTAHPDFGTELKKQNEIKTYFEHIDDSLYVLSMRLPKISTKIQDDLSSAHYNLEQSLENFSENRFPTGIANQRYVMTATNNLANYLSGILNNMMNPKSMKMGKGKGSGFSLPDIIKKQGELSKKMKEGVQKGKKPGKKKGEGTPSKPGKNGKPEGEGESGKGGQGKKGNGVGKDDLDGELYEIYKEQTLLRQQLQDAIKENEGNGANGNPAAKKVLKSMEQLENEILEKGFNAATLQKMQTLNYELLKLDKAALEQGKDKKRKSATNTNQFKSNNQKELQFKKLFYNQTEILNRQSLPLQQDFKKKVREYFSEPQKN